MCSTLFMYPAQPFFSVLVLQQHLVPTSVIDGFFASRSEACGDTMSSSEATAAEASWERSEARARPAPTVNTIRRIRQACTNCR